MSILAMILAGGKGERLRPLTIHRAKPAVHFGGIYRIIDFSLSNCINSGIRRIAVLTQYKSFSLDRHLRLGWDLFSSELNEYVISVPPQQRVGNKWYQGTADAIFQNIYMIGRDPPDHLLVLAGDHIYKMNYSVMFEFHMAHHADATVAAIEISRQAAASFGVLEVADDCRIVGFEEKPAVPKSNLIPIGVYCLRLHGCLFVQYEDPAGISEIRCAPGHGPRLRQEHHSADGQNVAGLCLQL